MQIAIVTGGSSGIGQSAAIQTARRGTGVILTYGANEAGALDTVASIEKEGGTAVALPLDVGRTAQSAMFEETGEELFDRLMRVLLRGPYFLTQTLLPLLTDGGAIVNVSSNSALPSGLEAGYSAYGTMKGGLTTLTRFLAKELSTRGIRVNTVSPGATRTRLSDNAFERFPEVIAPIAAKTALGRVGEPDDIGLAIASLLADEGRWITAQNIEVSGGYGL